MTTAMEIQQMRTEELLGDLSDVEKKFAAETLYLVGDTTLMTKGARVSIVGSRDASDVGLARARKLSRMLVERGVVVVSGLAKGIDTVAHRTAIEHGGRTIAVLGTAVDVYFPKENRDLQDEIARDHLLVSQFPVGSSGGKARFPMRNRTMALISDATVIIEAGEKSGTIHQGWEALRLGRSLYILESLAEAGHKWTSDMIKYGAAVLSEDTIAEFFESLPELSRVERAALTF